MAQYSSPRSPKSPATRPRPYPDPLAQQSPLVSGKWLLWSLAGIFGGGLGLVYLTMCLLFWQGQWQILFQPKHPSAAIPATFPIEDVSFGANQAGQPQLDGWFIPASAGAAYSEKTILYLHSMEAGSLASTEPDMTALHQLGVGLFAFDYRGFGQSERLHPSEQSATEDTEAAWSYLVDTRHIAPSSIVLYGVGLGASLAAEAAARHPESAAVILDRPSRTALTLLDADPRSHWMPVRLLSPDRFDATQALSTEKQPKLFLLTDQNSTGRRYAQTASDPKLSVYLSARNAIQERLNGLKRFLDEQPGNVDSAPQLPAAGK